MESGRQNEINFTINLIQELCETANITLMAKEVKGISLVAIHDNIDDKEYIIKKANGID